MATNAPPCGPDGTVAQAGDTLRANPYWAIPAKGRRHCGCGSPYQRLAHSLTKDGRTSMLDAGLSTYLVSIGWTPSQIAGWRVWGIAPPHVEREVVAQLVENTERWRDAVHRDFLYALERASRLALATLSDIRWLGVQLSTPRARRGGRRGVVRGGLATASPSSSPPQPARPAAGAELDDRAVVA